MFDIAVLYEAASVVEAIELRRAHPEARLIAGGSDLLVKIRDGKLHGVELISIRGIAELAGVCEMPDGTLKIGPLTSFSQLAADTLIRERMPVLGEAADEVGGPQIRNIGTVGGNVCNGVTSADTAPTLFASTRGRADRPGYAAARHRRFYLGPGRTDVGPGELLTAIYIPRISWERCFGRYIKYSMREALDISTLGCSVNARLSEDGRSLERVRIAYGVAGPVPCRCPGAERAFAGAPCTEETAREFARAAVAEISPRDSWRASRAFRLHVAEECALRALRESVLRAGGRL